MRAERRRPLDVHYAKAMATVKAVAIASAVPAATAVNAATAVAAAVVVSAGTAGPPASAASTAVARATANVAAPAAVPGRHWQDTMRAAAERTCAHAMAAAAEDASAVVHHFHKERQTNSGLAGKLANKPSEYESFTDVNPGSR